MDEVIQKLRSMKSEETGIIVYSPSDYKEVASYHSDLEVPLASAGKLALGFIIAKWVERKRFSWNDLVEDIRFHPKENSHQLYPHFQGRSVLPLRDAVEVMIACHDQYAAESLAVWFGGWNKMAEEVHSYFRQLHVTDNPTDMKNAGKLNHLMELLKAIYSGYEKNPVLWTPILNGLVRQRGGIEGVPDHQLLHMTGGLSDALVDVGILGLFHRNPWFYVVAGKDLPDRRDNPEIDETFIEVINDLYKNYQRKATCT